MPGERLRMRGVSGECHSCHEDAHAGQFADAGGVTDCSRCHGVERWPDARFDHDRDAAFPLRGAHETVPCASCHPSARDARGRDYLVFRPLPTACAGCHTG
ncbi:MAG: hypothetical protein R2991_10110 [Thermoanaerobaculia bacterium]